MYTKPELDLKYKAENWQDFPQDDRLRCHVCRGIYWRLWDNVAQCMGCRSYTGLEVNGPTGSLRDVEWIKFAMESSNDNRVRDPISGRSEWIVLFDKLKGRTSEQEMVLNPTIKGTWLMAKKIDLNHKALNNKEAISVIKKSTALKNRKSQRGEVAIGILLMCTLTVYLIGWLRGNYDLNHSDESRMSFVSTKDDYNVQR